MGQSNEAGAAKHWYIGTSGTSATTPTKFRSKYKTAFWDPIYPRVQPTTYKIGVDLSAAVTYQNPMIAGSWWTLLGDMLLDAGYDINLYNCAAGSLSFVNHVVGTLKAWSANKAFTSYQAPLSGGNLGYKGDFILVGTKVFQCTSGGGYGVAFYHNPGVYTLTENNAWRDHIDDLYWVPSPTNGKSASAAPNWAAATVSGDTVIDGGLVWTLVKTNEATYAAYPATNCVVDRNHVAFDPLGMLARTKSVLDAEPSNRTRWVFIQNGQSDLGTSDTYKTWYKTALTQIAQYFQAQGYKIAIGATCANPQLDPAGWTGVGGAQHPSKMISEAAVEVVSALNSPTNYILGGDLYSAFGYGSNLHTYPDSINSVTPGVHMTDDMMMPSAKVWYNALIKSPYWST